MMDQDKNWRAGVFADETENFRQPRFPRAGDAVTVQLRVPRGVKVLAFLCLEWENIPMRRVREDQIFTYFEAAFSLGTRPRKYHYSLLCEGEQYYYDRLGLCEGEDQVLQPFRVTPGFSVPEWALGAQMYQILPDRFCNGDPSNDVTDREYLYVEGKAAEHAGWTDPVADLDVARFYGGDLAGVLSKLDYLACLGVECIYFNPLFVSPSNHKYDSQDYDHIDPHLGKIVVDGGEAVPEGDTDNARASRYRIRTTREENLTASDELFQTLVREAHRRGIRVILDGVFNHCGSFHKWLDREGIYSGEEGYEAGAYRSADSPYRDYFRFETEDWPDNGSYEGWWGHNTLPKLNYEGSAVLKEEILRIAEKWVSPPFNADGWRLDVAADLGHSLQENHAFWRAFRERVKAANPDALILAEHYGDASPWLRGGEWDTVMNYDAFMEPVSFFLTGMEKHSDASYPERIGDGAYFFFMMKHSMARLQMGSLYSAMNELSNHDHSRFLTRTNGKVGRVAGLGAAAAEEGVDKAVLRLAAMIQFTWPGAPTIYYGDEAGLCGFTDPDDRRAYPWGKEDWELIEYHRELGRIHKCSALRTGSVKALIAGAGVIGYGRFDENDLFAVVINRSEEEREAAVPVWELGAADGAFFERVLLTTPEGYNVGRKDLPVENGTVRLRLPARSGVILRRSDSPVMPDERAAWLLP